MFCRSTFFSIMKRFDCSLMHFSALGSLTISSGKCRISLGKKTYAAPIYELGEGCDEHVLIRSVMTYRWRLRLRKSLSKSR